MWSRVCLVSTDISEEHVASIIPEDDILHSYRRENLKSYTNVMFPDTCWYGHYSLFLYMELVPEVCPRLSVYILYIRVTEPEGQKNENWKH
jgi:hypothetical protein